MAQACPKCARPNDDDAVICVGCDFILDTSFLGDDILNVDALAADHPTYGELPMPDTLAGHVEALQAAGSGSGDGDLGSGALILGKVGPDTGDGSEWASFESEQTGDFLCAPTSAGVRRFEPSTVYIDAETKKLLEAEAVLAFKDDVDLDKLMLSPFEHHVAQLIDGERPVARIQHKSGLSEEDLRICITLIADKGALVRVGTATSALRSDAFEEKRVATLDLSGEEAGGGGQAVSDFLDGPTIAGDLPEELPHDGGAEGLSPFVEDPELRPLTLPPEMLTPLTAPATPSPVAAPATPAASPLPGASSAAASGVPALPGQRAAAAAVPPLPGQPASSGVPGLPGQSARGHVSAPGAPPAQPKRAPARKPVVVEERSGGSASKGPPVERVARTDPTYKKALNLYETALRDVQAGRMARALGLARMAAQLCPDEGQFAELVNNWANAKQIAEQSDQAPEHVQAFHAAKAAEEAGDFDAAIASLQRAASLKPDHAGIQNQLGVLLATRKNDYTRALSHLFKAVELEKGNTAYRNNLGKVLAMSGGANPGALSDGSGGGARPKKGDGKKGGVLRRFLKR